MIWSKRGISRMLGLMERFFRNLLLGETWDLRSRYLHIAAPEEWRVQPQLVEKTSEKTIKTSEKTVKTSEKIIELLRTNSNYSAVEMAKILGRTPRAIELQLEKLQKANRLLRVGPDKGGHWKVIEVPHKE